MNNIYFSDQDSILIMGGTGFIGSHLVNACLSQTKNITVLYFDSRTEQQTTAGEVEYIQCDITHDDQVREVLKGRIFNYIFNLAGYIDHSPYFQGGYHLIQSHLLGIMNVLNHIDRSDLKGFVQIGSSDEYGDNPSPQTEEKRERPISPYAFAKTGASHLISMLYRTEGFPGSVVRLFLVYGPGQNDERFLPQVIKSCLKDEAFETTFGEQMRDFCYIDDAVDGLMRVASHENAKGEIINIASGQPVTIRSVVELVREILKKGKPQFGAKSYRSNENMELYADVAHAHKLFGWEAKIPLEEGLTKTIAYYAEEMT